MMFYTILIFLFSQLFAVLGLGNLMVTEDARAFAECTANNTCLIEDELEGESSLRFLKPKGGGGGPTDEGDEEDPAKEYFAVGLHMA